MHKNLLNWIRNFFAVEESTDRSTSIVSVEKINMDVDIEDCTEKDFNSLVKKLEDSLFNDCCMVCASKILPRFFPNINDMTRRMLTKIYSIKGSNPEECIGPLGDFHGWLHGTYLSKSEMNQIIKARGTQKTPDIYDAKIFGYHSEQGRIWFPIKKALWPHPDSSLFYTHSEVYISFSRQIRLCQLLEDIKLKKIQDILSEELSSKEKSIIRSDGLSRIRSMRVRFSWISYKITEKMLQIEQFSEVQEILGRNSQEQQEALRYVFSEYLKEMGSVISKREEETKVGSFSFIEYLSKTQSELTKKYKLEDIVKLDSWYASDDEIVQFVKYKNGDIYTCDGHEATMGIYKIPFSKLDRGSGKRGAAFENVVLEIFRTYLNIDCADSFYIKKKNDNETDAIAWKSDEKVVIVGECKINQRCSNLNISVERALSAKEDDEGYIVKSFNQLKERMKLIKNGEELKPIKSKSVNYTIPKDIKEYEVISLSIHASEYIPPMHLEGVHVISLESLVMVLRSVDGIKDFKKYMSFRKECIDRNDEKEYDEFDILYSYRKGNVKPENLKMYKCDSAWMPFDISDNEWREFISGRGEYVNLVRPI